MKIGLGISVAETVARPRAAAPAPAPSLSLSAAVSQAEGNSGATAFAWTLTLNRDGSTASYPYSWAVTGTGTNPANAADFGGTLPSGSGTFAPGETSKTITVLVAGDTSVEPAETFTLTVTASGLNTVSSIGTIGNDDTAPIVPNVTLPVTSGLTARWAANYSSVTTDANGRVTAITDLSGNNYTATDEDSGIGPKLVTYANGAKAVRHEYDSFLSALTPDGMGPRNSTVIIVGRHHSTRALTCTFLSFGRNSASPTNTLRGAFTSNTASGIAPWVGAAQNGTDAAIKKYLIAGSQLQVLGWANGSGATAGVANAGQRCGVNRKALNVAQQAVSATSAGLEIGRNAFSPGSAAEGNGSWATFDWYEVIVYNRRLTDAEFDSVMAALADAYTIPESTDQVIHEGDSRTIGVVASGNPGVRSGSNVAMVLTEPGASWQVPKTTRVINMALGGSTSNRGAASLRARLNTSSTTSALAQLLPGYNRVSVMIGHNDLSNGASGAADVYAGINDVISVTTPSYLSLGWEVWFAHEMHDNIDSYIQSIRALTRNAAFLTDNQAGAGQTYDGKLKLIDVPLATSGGQTAFNTAADTAKSAFWQSDRLHPNVAGTVIYATGGDTPQYGLRAMYG